MPYINTVSEFDQALEQGPFAWPGGYPCFFLCTDGEALSFDAAKENAELIREALESNDRNSSWHVAGFDINWEDTDLYCAHTNEKIQSAYGEDEAE
jgi:hypothetical protein